jgi:hypothetical protein
MSSGKSYDVRHPEMAFLTRTDIYARDFRICSWLHISAIEPLGLAKSGASA